MGAKIECYLDLVSFYSYLAFVELQRVRPVLASHSVEVEYHPVFIGAIMGGSGNNPPWALPAKGEYLNRDAQRAAERCGLPGIRFPAHFAKMAMSVLPLRALHFIQRSYPAGTFETTLSYLFHCFFTPPHTNVTDAATLQKTLREVPSEFDAASSSAPPASRRPPPPPPPLFSAREVDAIMRAATSQEAKDQLRAATDEALRRGAFGCPWFWVTDATGHAEAFFGSDRFHFMYKFLGLPFRDIALLPPSEAGTHGGQAKL